MILQLDKFLPYPDKAVFISTEWGVRLGFWDGQCNGFWLLDCTHPLQNRFMGMCYVSHWEYANPSDEQRKLFIENTVCRAQRQWEGEEILRQIKPDWKTKVLTWFRCLLPSTSIH